MRSEAFALLLTLSLFPSISSAGEVNALPAITAPTMDEGGLFLLAAVLAGTGMALLRGIRH